MHSECKTDENAGFQQDFQSPENQSLGAVLEYTMSLPVSGKGDHLNEYRQESSVPAFYNFLFIL